MEKMNILYVSSLCSTPVMHELFDTSVEKPRPAPQKFHSLMVKGLLENGCSVLCLVALPVNTRTHPGKKWWKRKSEILDGVRYVYIPFYNSPVPRLLSFKIYTFIYTLGWILRTHGAKAMICDVLNDHAFAAMRACKLMGVKTAGIVTDIPGYMNFESKKVSLLEKWKQRHDIANIRRMGSLIPLTDAMCEIINPGKKKDYVVVEGLVDSQMTGVEPKPYGDGKRHITYTGTLNAAFGVRTLIEGFMMLRQDDVVLDVYGKGPMSDEMNGYMEKDPRIRYHGVVTIEEAVQAQRSSFLLVNPRPTAEEFTKYSFPSKNMEYMATGVPVLTAVLPGMPEEYHKYVFLFRDETTAGISRMMDVILNMPAEEVKARGLAGKGFVMENKNNVRQAQRVLEMLMRGSR